MIEKVIKEKIDCKYKFTFLLSLILFFITHAYFFLGNYANEDYLHSLVGRKHTITSGRWLGELYSPYLMPWVVGTICAILLAFSVICIIALFKIENKVIIVLISALMITFPGLAYGYSYLFMADIYSISIFCAVFSVYITDKHRYGFIIGAIFLMISLAEYQSYIGVALMLCNLKVIFEIITGGWKQKGNKKFNIIVFKYILMGVLGVVFYFIGLQILLKLNNVGLVSYKGIDSMGQISITEIPRLFIKTYGRFLLFFIGDKFFYNNLFIKFVYVLEGILFLVLGKATFSNNNKGKIPFNIKALLAVCVCLVPLCGNPIDFVAPKTSATTLNIYAVVFLFVFILVLSQCRCKLNENAALNLIVAALACMIIINNYILTNVYYLKVSRYYEQTSFFENRLLTKIEMADGFKEDIPVAIIANDYTNFYGVNQNDYPVILNDCGLRRKIIGISEREGTEEIVTNKTLNFMNYILGVPLQRATQEDINKIMETEEYRLMGTYPEKDSIKVIDGILVVNMTKVYAHLEGGLEGDVLKFQLINEKNLKEFETAWYIYKNDKRIDVVWYSDNTNLEYKISEPGKYSVIAFFRSAEDNGQITSEEFVLE